jgi:hypothetical protein
MNDFVITLDIDWAPDWMIRTIASELQQAAVKATWFVTHWSPAIAELAAQPELFELGLHPNCLPNSTHGDTPSAVLHTIRQLLPNAVSMRTHALYQSTPFLITAARDFGVRYDVSLFLPKAPHLRPHHIPWYGVDLWRIPYFWEDDAEMFEAAPAWQLSDPRLQVPGLKVFDFHPTYLILNNTRFETYTQLKSLQALPTWQPEFVAPHRNHGIGPRTLFQALLQHLAGGGHWIRELIPASVGEPI